MSIMSVLPFIDAGVATAVGGRLVPPGPSLSEAEVAEVVAGLRAAAEASIAPVAEVTGLGAPATGETPPPPGRTSSTWVPLSSLDDVVLT